MADSLLVIPSLLSLFDNLTTTTTVPNATTTVLLPTTDHTTSVRPDSSTIPATTTPPVVEAHHAAPPQQYTDKAELLARAIEEGAADRTVFYVTLSLCLLQLLIVLGVHLARSCACRSTLDASATSLLPDEPPTKPAAIDEPKSLKTAREMKGGETSRRR